MYVIRAHHAAAGTILWYTALLLPGNVLQEDDTVVLVDVTDQAFTDDFCKASDNL